MTGSYPQHFKLFDDNVKEVRNLLDIHRKIAKKTPGRKYNVEVLNKSGVVLLVACWESYVEHLADSAFNILLKHSKNPTDFPVGVRIIASKSLKESKDERKIWELAGDGWKRVLSTHKDNIIKSHVYSLNTPKTKNINELFKSTIWFSNVSSKWKIPKMDNNSICGKLDNLLNLRGEIAHQVKASKSVNKRTVISHTNFIERLSVILSNEVNDHLEKLTGKEPWGHYQYTRTK